MSYECYCDYDNGPELFSEATPVARKEHKCFEFRGVIKPGEKYTTHAGKWDGLRWSLLTPALQN